MIRKRKNILITILVIGFIARFVFMLSYSDLKNDFYWEYGNLAKNLNAGNGYSLFYFENDSLRQDYKPIAKPYPSALMPPAYVFYLYPFLKIDNIELRNLFIFTSQILLSLILIVAVYLFASKYFSERVGIISALIVALLPEFIYSSVAYNAVIHYHLLVILILSLLLKKELHDNIKNIILFFALSSLLLYFRFEFSVFLFFVLILFLIKKKYKAVLIGLTILIISISPWIIRNFLVFDKFLPFTTNGGLNLYRGHNRIAIGNWGSWEFVKDIKDNSNENNFEIVYQSYYLDKAIKSIKENPSSEFKFSLIKIFNLWIMNPGDGRSFHPAYLIPSIILLILTFWGIIKTFSFTKYKYIYLFLFYSTLIAVIFLALPRYQTMMKITFIPFAAYSIDFIISKFKSPELKQF